MGSRERCVDLDPDAVREYACLVADMIAAGLRAREA